MKLNVDKTMQKNARILTQTDNQAGLNRAVTRICEKYFNDDIDEFISWFNDHDDERFTLARDGIEQYEKSVYRRQRMLESHESHYSDKYLEHLIDEDTKALHDFEYTPDTAWCIVRKSGVTGMLRPLDILAIVGTIKGKTNDWNVPYFANALKHYGKYAPLLKRLTAPLSFKEATAD